MLIRFIREIFQVEDKKDVNFGYVAAGDGFSLALTLDREVLYSFGHASYGQLGIGVDKARSSDRYTTPQVVTFPKSVDIVSISAGDRHASALTSDHELYTWGFNEVSTTGHRNNGAEEDIFRPTLLNLDMERGWCPVQFSGGGQHSLLLVRPKLAE